MTVDAFGANGMLMRILVFLLAGLLAFCGTAGVALGMLATNRLTPPSATIQVGSMILQALPPCGFDQVASTPCLLPDTDARWLIQVERHDSTGQRQRWALYGGGHAPLRVSRR
jgi:hypothetical protein